MGISNISNGWRFCPSCKMEKELSNYTIRKNGRVTAWCKPCTAERSRKYRENNREKYLQSKKDFRQRWKEKHSVVVVRQNWDNLTIEEKEKQGCGIYCITIGDWFYIGSCVNFNRRMKDHTRKLGYGKHINKIMQAAFDKYQMFEVEMIECCEPQNLLAVEQSYIDQWFNNERCMNLKMETTSGIGYRRSERQRENARIARLKYLESVQNGN